MMKATFVRGTELLGLLEVRELAAQAIELYKEKEQLEQQQLKALTVGELRNAMKRIDEIEEKMKEIDKKIKILIVAVIL